MYYIRLAVTSFRLLSLDFWCCLFATCHLNVSSHTRKGSRLGKFSCILCFALLQNRVLINGCLRSWFFITRIFNMSLFCPHSSILLQFNVSCLQGRLSFTFVFFFSPFFNFVSHVCFEFSFSLIRQTESKDTPTLTHGLAEVSTKHSFKHYLHTTHWPLFRHKSAILFSFFFFGGGGGGEVGRSNFATNQPVIKVKRL